MTNAPEFQCLSPAFQDWRLLAGSAAIGKGQGKWLTEKIILPAGETHKDILGNPIDTTGAVDCGAVQAPAVTPVGGRLRFGTKATGYRTPFYHPEGVSANAGYGAYHYGTNWPATYRIKYDLEGSVGRLPLFWTWWYDGSEKVARRPDYSGYVSVVPPSSVDAELQINTVAADGLFYADAVNGNDSWDGTSPTHTSGAVGPKKTLQAVANLSFSDHRIAMVAPGVYDEGGTVLTQSGNSLSNRLYVVSRNLGFVASEGPGTAVLKGAPDPDTQGLGPKATRCFGAGGSSCDVFLQGIDLTGGHTATEGDPAARGAAGYFGNNISTLLCDCTVSNNVAYFTDMFYGQAHRVRFLDNSAQATETVRFANLTSCLFARNTSTAATANRGIVGAHCKCWGCTFDADGSDSVACTSINTCYFFGCLFSPSADLELSNHSASNVFSDNPYFADPASDDYRLGVLSAARAGVSSVAYGRAGTNAFLRLQDDLNGVPLVWKDGTAAAGAVRGTACPMYAITADGLAVEGGVLTNTITMATTLHLTATRATTRPFLGFEINGTLVPVKSAPFAYDLAVDPADGVSYSVRAVYGTTWYVNGTSGSDSASGAYADAAKLTIYGATSHAVAGDTILVAPGTYGEDETPQAHTKKVDDDFGPDPVKSLVFVPAGVTVIATEGAEKTFIVGRAATNPDSYGNGTDAVRCVFLDGSASQLTGFTLTGGHTGVGTTARDCYQGAGVLGRSGWVTECIISNNFASRCAGGFNTKFKNCRFLNNGVSVRASAGRVCSFLQCLFDGNLDQSGEEMIQYFNRVEGCTIGSDNKVSSGAVSSAAAQENAGSTFYNNLVLTRVSSGLTRVKNCAFVEGRTMPAEQYRVNCVVTNAASLQLDADYRPVIGANAAIDAGDVSLIASPLDDETDLSGVQRVMNAHMDIGAMEADWRPVYATDLGGRRLETTAVSPAVYESELHGPVRIPSGTITFRLTSERAGDSRLNVRLQVTGNGMLTLRIGETGIRTYTAASGAVDEMLTVSAGTTALRFAYVPGTDDTGWAELKRLRLNRGSMIIIR